MFPPLATVASTGLGRLPVVGPPLVADRSLDVGRPKEADPLSGVGLLPVVGPPLGIGLLKDAGLLRGVLLAEPLEYSERVD